MEQKIKLCHKQVRRIGGPFCGKFRLDLGEKNVYKKRGAKQLDCGKLLKLKLMWLPTRAFQSLDGGFGPVAIQSGLKISDICKRIHSNNGGRRF